MAWLQLPGQVGRRSVPSEPPEGTLLLGPSRVLYWLRAFGSCTYDLKDPDYGSKSAYLLGPCYLLGRCTRQPVILRTALLQESIAVS